MNLVSSNFLGWGGDEHSNHNSRNPTNSSSVEVTDSLRDEVPDHPISDNRDEPGGEEEQHDTEEQKHHDEVSMFSTLTELLLNPFLDGYCKTPFCSDMDYFPPACPSMALYSSAPHEARDYYSTSTPHRQHHHHHHHHHQNDEADEYGDIARSGSRASGDSSGHRRKHRQRPLALAVGYGDEWKDSEGRRVVITPRRNHHMPQPSPSRGYNTKGQQQQPVNARHATTAAAAAPTSCTCAGQVSSNSLTYPEDDDHYNLSPHQSKNVICKFCSSRLKSLGVPPTTS